MAEVRLEEVPRKTRELFDKAAAAIERDNVEYGIAMLLNILDIEPRLLPARKLLRVAQVKRFRAGGGNPALRHVMATLSGIGGLVSAEMAMRKNPVRALQTVERLMNRDPLNKIFYTRLARAAEAADLPEVALHTLEMARETAPNDLALLNELARLYRATDQVGKARECIEKVVEVKPNDPVAIKMLKDVQAQETMERGRWTEATSYRDVMKDAEGAQLLEQQSKAVKSAGDLASLIADGEKKVAAEPDNINYKRALAEHYVRAERFDDAEALLEEVNRTSGGGDPQVDRALSQIRVRRFDRRIETLRADGKDAEARAVEEERETFRFKDAEERVARYPNDLQFKYEFGELLYARERYTDAIQQFQLAQRNPQRRVRALFYLGLCFAHKDQYDIAIEQLQKAVSELTLMDDTKKDVLYELGVVHEKAGHRDEAAACFKDIYAADIGYRDVAEKVEKTYRS